MAGGGVRGEDGDADPSAEEACGAVLRGAGSAVAVEERGDGSDATRALAFCPDLPGCVAAGKTRVEANKNLREAIILHLEGLRDDAVKPPRPHSSARCVRFKLKKPARRASEFRALRGQICGKCDVKGMVHEGRR